MKTTQLIVSIGVYVSLFAQAGCQESSNAAKLPHDVQAATASDVPQTRNAAAEAADSETASAAASQRAGAVGATQVFSGGATQVFSGTTEAYRQSTISAKVGGTVVSVAVREGMSVKAGQTLVQIDPTDYRLRLRQATAALDVARAQERATRIEWKRLAELIKSKAVPRSQYEQTDSQLQVAKAAVAQAEVAVDMARQGLRDATVRAPYAGIVTQLFVHRGEYATTMPPTHLVTVEQVDKLDLRVQLPETAMLAVAEGTPLQARFVASNQTLIANVTRVVRSINARSRSFSVLVELDNANGRLRPGMFAEVRLTPAAQASASKDK